MFRSISLCAVLLGVVPAQAAVGAYVNFEGKQTAPVRLSPSGKRLFAVNTPGARLSVFDVSVPQNPILIAEIPVGLEPVSVQPLNDDEVWVVNEVSDSVSIVSVNRSAVVETLVVKDEPADVVFAQGRAFVSASRNHQIAVFDITNRVRLTNFVVEGESPRALAVSLNGTKVYAAFALSGNRTTLVPLEQAPPQPPPTNPFLPVPPPVGLIVDATDPAWTNGANAPIQYTMPDQDIVEIDVASLAITRYFPGVGTINLGLAVHPASGDLFVANTDARNLARFEPNIRGNAVSNRISRVHLADGTVTHHDLNPGFSYTNFPRLLELSNALAQPTALVFGPSGSHFYVAAYGSDRVARMTADGEILNRVELNPDSLGSLASPRTKRGPRGLALKPGRALYVLNRISNTLTVIEPEGHTVVREIPVGSYDPTPDAVRQGRGFLYDAKLSGNGTVSCASCHIDAEMDQLAWDLGDPAGSLQTFRSTNAFGVVLITRILHPMKGPMTTQTLKGLTGQDPLHWRGDRANFLQFNSSFHGLLGGAPISDADMQLFRNFIDSLVFQPNPNQNLDRSYPTALPTRNGTGNPTMGHAIFNNVTYSEYRTCATCHIGPEGSSRVIFPGGSSRGPQDLKVPHLRNVYQKLGLNRAPGARSVGGFGLMHHGGEGDIFHFLGQNVFEKFSTNFAFKRDLDAFVQCFDTGLAPAVGYGRTLRTDNVDGANVVSDWNLLEQQAGLTNIDLVVKGTVEGRLCGFVYKPATHAYQPDSLNLPAMTRAQLRGLVLAGDTLTLMGVPVGSGVSHGVDRNLDGVMDGDVTAPSLRITVDNGQTVVSWPTNAAGFLLEKTEGWPALQWTPEVSERAVGAGEYSVNHSLSLSNLFFRLRGL